MCVCAMQIPDMEQHMQDALTLPVTAVRAAFNLTKAIVAPDGGCLTAFAAEMLNAKGRAGTVLPDHTGRVPVWPVSWCSMSVAAVQNATLTAADWWQWAGTTMPSPSAAGDMQPASAPEVAGASGEDMPAAPEQGSAEDAASEEEALPEQEAPSEEAPSEEAAVEAAAEWEPAAEWEMAAEWEPAAEWETAADEALPAQGPAARESSAVQEAAFSLLTVQQEVAVAGAQSAVGMAEIVAVSDTVSTSTDSATSGVTQDDTLHRALQPQSYSILEEGREVVRPGKDVAPIIL